MLKQNKKEMIVVDLSVLSTSPAGSCVLSEIKGISKQYDVHVLSTEIDEKLKDEIIFHHIRSVRFPLVLRYIIFSLKVHFKIKKLLKTMGETPIIQTTQGQYVFSHVAYPHFCHRAYLQKYWGKNGVKGVKRQVRKLNHRFNQYMETKAFKNAKKIVVPSQGLRKELIEFYPNYEHKVEVIPNPIDIKKFEKPVDFDPIPLQESLNINPKDIVIAFVALGDFERKGLSHLIESLTIESLQDHSFKLLVIGGTDTEINVYKEKAKKFGVEDQLIFVGFQKDIRNYLWVSTIFSLPSLYEIFPLVAVQAAAAKLPLLVSNLHGVKEYLENDVNGWLIDRNAESIAQILGEIVRNEHHLEEMGVAAHASVKKYDHESFRKKWISLYEEVLDAVKQ